MNKSAILLLVLAVLAPPALAGGLEVGKAGGNFTLEHGDGQVTLAGIIERDDTKAVVVTIASYTCPYSLRADRDLKPLLAPYAGKGVRFVAVYPNKHETAEGVAQYAKRHEFAHLMLRDPDGAVSRSFGAEVTPTFFLFDKTGTLRYRGNLGSLAAAMDAVLEGSTVAKPTTAATGCTVKWPEVRTPEGGTYTGPPGEIPPRETPREGPRDPEPPELSKAADKWLRKLIKVLASDDPLVVRSASAAIMSFGPPAMPKLRAALESAEDGATRRNLSRIIDQMASRGRPGMAPGRGRAGRGEAGGRPRGSFLDRQRERIEGAVDLTDEQKKQVEELYSGLKVREKELRKMAEEGGRERGWEGFRQLMLDARAGLAEILTEEQTKKLEEMRGGFRGGPGGGRRGAGGGRVRGGRRDV